MVRASPGAASNSRDQLNIISPDWRQGNRVLMTLTPCQASCHFCRLFPVLTLHHTRTRSAYGPENRPIVRKCPKMSGNVRIIHILPHSRDRETLERFFMEPLSDSVPRPLVIPVRPSSRPPPSSPRKRGPRPPSPKPTNPSLPGNNPIPYTYASNHQPVIPAPSVFPAKAGTQAPVSKTHQPAIARKRPDSPHIKRPTFNRRPPERPCPRPEPN